MQIKKRITAAAKKITPQIEAGNTGIELAKLTQRFEELVDYAVAKEERRAETEKTGKPFAQRYVDNQRKVNEERERIQEQERREQLEDQGVVDAEEDEGESISDAEAEETRIASEVSNMEWPALTSLASELDVMEAGMKREDVEKAVVAAKMAEKDAG